jgi:hypothetical protein
LKKIQVSPRPEPAGPGRKTAFHATQNSEEPIKINKSLNSRHLGPKLPFPKEIPGARVEIIFTLFWFV